MACQHCISNSDDVIDSRQVIARIEELESNEERTEEETAELATLQALAAEASDYAADWRYGATLIRDSYFEGYIREDVEEVRARIDSQDWPPFNRIDWKAVVNERQMDYTSVSFDGVDYWIR